VSVPVEHAAALGGELHLADALIEPELRVTLPTEGLEVHEARADGQEDQDEHDEEADQAAPGRTRSRPPGAELGLTSPVTRPVTRELVAADFVSCARAASEQRCEPVATDPVRRAGHAPQERRDNRLVNGRGPGRSAYRLPYGAR
jgi:hypothetical protein